MVFSLLTFGAAGSAASGPFTISSGHWSSLGAPAGQPFGRSGPGLAFDPGLGLGLMFGGRDAGGAVLGDTWLNDGDHPGRWASYSDPGQTFPPPLARPAITWDATDHYFVMFGGTTSGGAAYGGTWTFLDFQWANLTANQSIAPPPDAQPTMVYDSADGEVVLLGGGPVAATWAFQAGHWRSVPTSSGPTPREGAVAVDDPYASGVVLYGGTNASTHTPLNETWVFSGGAWTRVTTGLAPPGTAATVGTYDPRSNELVVFIEEFHETWGYQNGTWGPTTTAAATSPNAVDGASMYYDSILGYPVLFGGIDPLHRTVYAAWGWDVPPDYTDPTLSSAAVNPTIWAGAALVVIVPILLALWWRRPPRPSVATAPSSAPSPA